MKATFDKALREARELYGLGKALDQTRLPDELVAMGFSRSKGRMIAAQALLRLMGSWEQFVEGVFLRFMTGVVTPTNVPKLLRPPEATLDKAFIVLVPKATSRHDRYTSWTKWQEVEGRARKYFDGGAPFARVLSPTGADAAWYALALAVRNRVAHPSESATRKFVDAARAFRGVPKLTRGYSAGELLLSPVTPGCFNAKHKGSTVFEAIAASMEDLAATLVGLLPAAPPRRWRRQRRGPDPAAGGL